MTQNDEEIMRVVEILATERGASDELVRGLSQLRKASMFGASALGRPGHPVVVRDANGASVAFRSSADAARRLTEHTGVRFEKSAIYACLRGNLKRHRGCTYADYDASRHAQTPREIPPGFAPQPERW